ncbi:hypothetical protein Tco_0922745 [Tanacetum coccineum]|uniref:Uncharacterized protein n=1 Tax=Tanacetum coccineum TaxID=301880 RepID=A0ABQ5D2B9_9ASTR
MLSSSFFSFSLQAFHSSMSSLVLSFKISYHISSSIEQFDPVSSMRDTSGSYFAFPFNTLMLEEDADVGVLDVLLPTSLNERPLALGIAKRAVVVVLCTGVTPRQGGNVRG